MTQPAKVAGTGNPGAANTAPSGNGASQGAPATVPANAQQGTPSMEQLQAQIAKLNNDINRVKSSYDQRLNQSQREYEQRIAQMQQQLQDAQTRGMTDEQRQQYEAAQRNQAAQALFEQNQLLQQQLHEQQLRFQYTNWFLSKGVPADKLNQDGTLDDLNASGYEHWQALMSNPQHQAPPANGAAPANGQPPAQGATVVPPPDVVTENVPTAGLANTWAEIEKAHGMTQEEIYEAVEHGVMDPSIIPLGE